MKVLSLGSDKTVLNQQSALAGRLKAYGDLVDKYTVVVPADKDDKVELSDKVTIYGIEAKNKVLGLFKIYSFIKKLLRSEAVDVITVQDQYFLGWVACKLSKKFKIGLEIQVHGFEKFSGLRKKIAYSILPQAQSIRVVSQRLKNQLINDFKVPGDRITVIPIYVKIKDSLTEQTKQNDKFIFLTIGRLVPVKNFALQIRAMAKIVEQNQNVELWILGAGPLEKELRCLAKQLDLLKQIKFLGWQNDLNKYYQQADTFMLTSYAEGWPLVIVEAAGYGLPIIMTDVGSAGELIINNQSGLVVPVNDKDKLVAAMENLIKDSDLRTKLGQGARQAAVSLPSQQENLQLYKQSWQKAISK